MDIYYVLDGYINYLRSFDKLNNIYFNKNKSRPYTGTIIVNKSKEINYFIPMSTVKDNDYNKDKSIRSDGPTIIRMKDIKDNRLLGTLRLSHMIPVPTSQLNRISIDNINDDKHKRLLSKELAFIKHNKDYIIKKSVKLYNQKSKEHTFNNIPKYIVTTVDFKFAEEKCKEWERKHIEKVTSEYDKRQKDTDIER